jgi:hypothetical protein
VKRKVTALSSISFLFITCLVIPVSAFYFDFQYFETDKLVYEVGESIDMVAKIIADFSDEGWCFVSFAVVTDIGPSYADEYFISSSPAVRFLNSSYTILPDHASPGETGIDALVLFTVEIYDTVTQSAGDNIEITINRGHLVTIPLASLSVELGTNTSIPLRISSIHNSNIVYSNEFVNLRLENEDTQTVLLTNTTTTADGLVYLNWNESIGPSGHYNLTVSCGGNEDFLPMSNSFQFTVLPASSNLTIVSAPETVYCQSPDGNHINLARITIAHSNLNQSPIIDSIVQWNTSFGSGVLTNMGNGSYSSMIAFNIGPGLYRINFTAINSQYQTIETSIGVSVLANPLQFFATQSSRNVTRSTNATIDFLIESTLSWNQSMQLRFSDVTSQFSQIASVSPNLPSSVIIPIWQNISVGHHIITISPTSEYYQFSVTPHIDLTVFGTLNCSLSVNIAYYNETLGFNLEALDDSNQPLSTVELSIFCDNSSTPFAFISLINSGMNHTVSLPTWILPGTHNITFGVSSQYFESINYSVSIRIWMRTNITIVISSAGRNPIIKNDQSLDILRRISSGSIMSPPPILYKGITSTIPPTARFTSLES